MELTKITFNRADLIESARAELHTKWKKEGDPEGPWGYYAIQENDDTEYPACTALRDALIKEVEDDYTFGFIQYYPENGNPRNGPLHLDVHKLNAIEGEEERPEDSHIQRRLINLNSHPRKLKFLPTSRAELESRGFTISTQKYQPIEPPDDLEIKIQEIPAVESGTAWQLTFLGDDVPHAGFTDQGGQMLACFGKYI